MLVALAHTFANNEIIAALFGKQLDAMPDTDVEVDGAWKVDAHSEVSSATAAPVQGDEAAAGQEPKLGTNMEAEASLSQRFLSLLLAVPEREPDEAKALRAAAGESTGSGRRAMGREERNELSTVAVKRAFSECPNISILCKALQVPSFHTKFHENIFLSIHR